ncbi:MAG: PIN domain-containing protein [Micrococcales bacterium]|nr:PIN domain-containing protein [Micrococcales bacterium]MCL2668224.1 PIN domain-containing protein [Micrococcales bacterium]
MVYDTGALIAAERGVDSMWARHKRLVERGGEAIVPAVVVTEAWRGTPRQHRLGWFLDGCTIIPVTEDAARAAGVLLRTASHGAVDALVTQAALQYGCPCVTSNRAHIEALAGSAQLTIIDV